jgi:hypothetical protein
MFRLFILFAVFLFTSLQIFADSPITSTPFSTAYSQEKIIQTTIKAKGIITQEIIDYLTKKGNPIELKMAVINQLGWQEKVKDNAVVFYRAINFKYRYKSEEEFKQKGDGDELLSYAYLKAMDDYQEVTPALKFAEAALEKNPKSLTYNLIAGLIKAQKAMDSDWCEVYKITDSIQQNSELTIDIKSEATQIIYKYMDGYKEFCK